METNTTTAPVHFDITSHAHITYAGVLPGSDEHATGVLSVYRDEEAMTPQTFAEMVSDEVLRTVTYGVEEVWTKSEVSHSLKWCHGHCATVVAENS